MSEWKPYLHDRLIAEKNGYFVIVPNEAPITIPLCCPVCSFVLRSKDDEASWYEFNCCNHCALLWASSRKIEWANGWRPSKSQLDDDALIRLPMVIELDVD